METVTWLADHIGSRLTNSPAMRTAEQWAQQRLRTLGLADVRTEAFAFGRGWTIEEASATMIVRAGSFWVHPRGSDPRHRRPDLGQGPTRADHPYRGLRDMARQAYREDRAARVRRAVRTTRRPRRSRAVAMPTLPRWIPSASRSDPAALDRLAKTQRFNMDVEAFLKVEGALAWGRMSSHESGLVSGEGFGFRIGHTPPSPGIEIEAEEYRRIARLSNNHCPANRYRPHRTKSQVLPGRLPAGRENCAHASPPPNARARRRPAHRLRPAASDRPAR
jgi:carboxypeptidase Q